MLYPVQPNEQNDKIKRKKHISHAVPGTARYLAQSDN
jgi:hypothetical protein